MRFAKVEAPSNEKLKERFGIKVCTLPNILDG